MLVLCFPSDLVGIGLSVWKRVLPGFGGLVEDMVSLESPKAGVGLQLSFCRRAVAGGASVAMWA